VVKNANYRNASKRLENGAALERERTRIAQGLHDKWGKSVSDFLLSEHGK